MGPDVGDADGANDGDFVGASVGADEGQYVGSEVGNSDGDFVDVVGSGDREGCKVGAELG